VISDSLLGCCSSFFLTKQFSSEGRGENKKLVGMVGADGVGGKETRITKFENMDS